MALSALRGGRVFFGALDGIFLGQAPDGLHVTWGSEIPTGGDIGLHAGNKKPLPRVGKEGFL